MSSIKGVFSAAATPVNADLTPDHGALVAHSKQLLADGLHGVALLGSTGEANSFSSAERMAMLEAVVAGGVPADALLPGTGLCALPETIALTKRPEPRRHQGRDAAALLLQGRPRPGALRRLRLRAGQHR
jgi:4-hydroxy-tetrahydrodipicolinate synthase